MPDVLFQVVGIVLFYYCAGLFLFMLKRLALKHARRLPHRRRS